MSTTHPITPETQVPWPCWLWLSTIPRLKGRNDSWVYFDTPVNITTATFYSTLPASQRPEEPTLGGDSHAGTRSSIEPPLVRSDPVPAATAAQGLFLAEMIGGLQSARECCRMNMHGDGAAMVDMRLEQAIDIVTKHLGGDEHGSVSTGDEKPLVRSDPVPAASQPLALALEAAAREGVAFGQPTVEELNAILQRHVAPEFEQLQAKLEEARDLLEAKDETMFALVTNGLERQDALEAQLTRTQAALEAANARALKYSFEWTKEVTDLRAQLTTLRSAADADRERLAQMTKDRDRWQAVATGSVMAVMDMQDAARASERRET